MACHDDGLAQTSTDRTRIGTGGQGVEGSNGGDMTGMRYILLCVTLRVRAERTSRRGNLLFADNRSIYLTRS